MILSASFCSCPDCMCIYSHTNTSTQMHVHTCTHKCTHCAHTDMHMCIHEHTHTQRNMCVPTSVHTHTFSLVIRNCLPLPDVWDAGQALSCSAAGGDAHPLSPFRIPSQKTPPEVRRKRVGLFCIPKDLDSWHFCRGCQLGPCSVACMSASLQCCDFEWKNHI
jgi:hypothetical protein